MPASTAKLAVTAAALTHLKPEFRYKTALRIKKDEAGKRSLSVLVWRGSGDPSISGRGRSSPYEIFELWGDLLAARGVRDIRSLVLDDRYFEGPATVPSWPADELSYWYAAQTSAIAYNDDCVGLDFRPGPRPGRRANISLTPDFGYVQAVNRTLTGPPGAPFTLDYRREPEGNKVAFFGGIGATDTVRSDYVAVHRPALFAAHTLRRVWRRKGLRVGSKTISWERSGLAEERLLDILVWESEPLSRLVQVINKNSQNFYAEQLLKTLGKEVDGLGSFAAGTAVVGRFMEQAGLAASDYRLVDGSGLSRENRMTAAGLVRLLELMSASPLFAHFYDSLAVPGVDRSLRNRMKGDDSSAARMRLKAGTIDGAKNLAGYFRSRSGALYAFAVLVNGPGLDRRAVSEAVDRLCLQAARTLP